MDDDAIGVLVKRLSRPDGSRGVVIESAAIMAEGSDSTAIVEWIVAHGGQPEAVPAAKPTGGLHGVRGGGSAAVGPSAPRRYVLPQDALP